MDGLVSNAAMILLSLHPSPASETSAFNKIRAFSSRWAGLFPFRIRTSSCSRSSPLNRTTYFFTEISFAAMIRLRRRIVDKANHQILTNWLKRATSRSRAQLYFSRSDQGADLERHDQWRRGGANHGDDYAHSLARGGNGPVHVDE